MPFLKRLKVAWTALWASGSPVEPRSPIKAPKAVPEEIVSPEPAQSVLALDPPARTPEEVQAEKDVSQARKKEIGEKKKVLLEAFQAELRRKAAPIVEQAKKDRIRLDALQAQREKERLEDRAVLRTLLTRVREIHEWMLQQKKVGK